MVHVGVRVDRVCVLARYRTARVAHGAHRDKGTEDLEREDEERRREKEEKPFCPIFFSTSVTRLPVPALATMVPSTERIWCIHWFILHLYLVQCARPSLEGSATNFFSSFLPSFLPSYIQDKKPTLNFSIKPKFAIPHSCYLPICV